MRRLEPLERATRENIRAALSTFEVREFGGANAAFPPATPASPPLRYASVALCLGMVREQPSFLLIKRVGRGLNPGQYALPGGKRDAGESTVETALRELHEEVGVAVAPDDVLGRLDDYVTATGFIMQPVVVAPRIAQRLVRSVGEVASINPIPLERITAPGTHRVAHLPEGRVEQWKLRSNLVLHAPTAAIVHQLGMLANRGEVVRVNDLVQPEFTHS